MFGILSILIVSTLGVGVVLKLTTRTSNISSDNVYVISEDLTEQIRTMQHDIASLKERNEKLEQELRDLRDEKDKSQSIFEGTVDKPFFNSVLRPFQDYFSSYETGQSVGGAKTGEPREKNTWHTRKQNLA